MYLIGIALLLVSTAGNSLLAIRPETFFGINISAAVLGMVLGSIGTGLIRHERKRKKRLKKLKKRRYKHYYSHFR